MKRIVRREKNSIMRGRKSSRPSSLSPHPVLEGVEETQHRKKMEELVNSEKNKIIKERKTVQHLPVSNTSSPNTGMRLVGN